MKSIGWWLVDIVSRALEADERDVVRGDFAESDEPGVGFFLAAYRHPEIWQSWQVRVSQFVVYWPAAYLISYGAARRWHRIHA